MTDTLASLQEEWDRGFRSYAEYSAPVVAHLIERVFVVAEADHAEVTRLARGHDEYNRVNQLLTAENDTLREALRGFLAWYMDDTAAPSQLGTVVAAARAALTNRCVCNGQGGCCR